VKAEIRRENIKPFLNKRYQRLLKITTPKKQMENKSRAINVDVHRQDENRTNDNDIIDHQTKVQTSRKRAYSELRNEGVSPSKVPRIVKSKRVLANVLTDEIETLYKESDQQGKSTITSMLSSKKLKKYSLKQTLSTTTGIRRHSLKRKNENLTKMEKRSRNQEKCTKLSNDINKLLGRDDNSRDMPSKNDKAKTVKGHVQRRVLNDNMAFLHMKYQVETSSKVSFSAFCVMRPKHIGLTRYLSRNKCLCQKHQNMPLALKSMKKAGAEVPFIPDELNRKLSTTYADSFLSSITDDDVAYFQWKKGDIPGGKKRTIIVEQKKTKDEFISVMRKNKFVNSQNMCNVQKPNMPPYIR